jgi:hypothetical protein
MKLLRDIAKMLHVRCFFLFPRRDTENKWKKKSHVEIILKVFRESNVEDKQDGRTT